MKIRIVILFTVIISSLLALVLFSGKNKSGTIVVADVNEVVANPERYRNRELRIRGVIKPGSVLRYGDKANFVLTFGKKDLKVRFDGSTQLPDSFGDGAPARADGKLNDKMELVSTKVEAKCASKYEAKHAQGKSAEAGYGPALKKKGYKTKK